MIDQQPLEHRPSAPPPLPSRERVWHVVDFLEIQSIVGRDRAETLLRSYVLHLDLASALIRDTGFDATHLREVVHNLKSMSGQLGFEALHDFCDRVLMSPNAALLDEAVKPLLVLIGASSEAARAHGRRSKIAGTSLVA